MSITGQCLKCGGMTVDDCCGPCLKRECDELKSIIDGQAAAVREHHSQKADDRCIDDDSKLYAAFGLEPADHHVGDRFEMLKNCARFIELRCCDGRWPSYRELEEKIERLSIEIDLRSKEVARLEREIERLEDRCDELQPKE